MTAGKTIALTRWTFVGKVVSLLFNTLSRLIIAFLPRCKCLLISWLQSPSAVIFEPKKIKSVTVFTVSPSICHDYPFKYPCLFTGYVQLFVTPWTAALQAFLSSTVSQSLLKFMSIELVMPCSHLYSIIPFSSCHQSFPTLGSFPLSLLFISGGQSTGALASVLPVNMQVWFPLGLTHLISLLSKGLSRVFCTTVWKHQFFCA